MLYAADDMLVLVDPLVRDELDPGAWQWLDEAVASSSMPVGVLLTAPWHERSTRDVVGRYDAKVWATAAAHGRIRDLPQLESLPVGITAFEPRGVDEGQVAFVLEDEQALVVAELFLGTEAGLKVLASPATRDRREFADSLAELARRPIQRILVAHGPPVLRGGNDAIATALRAFEDSRGGAWGPAGR